MNRKFVYIGKNKVLIYSLPKRIGYAFRNKFPFYTTIFGIPSIPTIPSIIDIHVHNTWKDIIKV